MQKHTEEPRLTAMQRRWVEEYLQSLNATEAAIRAGYSGGYNICRRRGFENASNPKIREIYEAEFKRQAMGGEEVVRRLGDQAKADASTMARVFRRARQLAAADWSGEVPAEALRPEHLLQAAGELQMGHLIKKIKQTQHGLEVELYDAQRALELLGKYHVLFTERTEHAGQIEVEGTWSVTWDGPEST